MTAKDEAANDIEIVKQVQQTTVLPALTKLLFSFKYDELNQVWNCRITGPNFDMVVPVDNNMLGPGLDGEDLLAAFWLAAKTTLQA